MLPGELMCKKKSLEPRLLYEVASELIIIEFSTMQPSSRIEQQLLEWRSRLTLIDKERAELQKYISWAEGLLADIKTGETVSSAVLTKPSSDELNINRLSKQNAIAAMLTRYGPNLRPREIREKLKIHGYAAEISAAYLSTTMHRVRQSLSNVDRRIGQVDEGQHSVRTSVREAAFHILRASPSPMTPAQLCHCLKEQQLSFSRNYVSTLLGRAVEQGQVVKVGKYYSFPLGRLANL